MQCENLKEFTNYFSITKTIVENYLVLAHFEVGLSH